MERNDCDYFLRRAEQELELAQHPTSRAAVVAHFRLAEANLKKAEQGGTGAGAG
jgi:hypothetical protein